MIILSNQNIIQRIVSTVAQYYTEINANIAEQNTIKYVVVSVVVARQIVTLLG